MIARGMRGWRINLVAVQNLPECFRDRSRAYSNPIAVFIHEREGEGGGGESNARRAAKFLLSTAGANVPR